jgi:hypothetical protein
MASAKAKRDRLDYDAVIKDLFERDHPSLLDGLLAGRKITGSLNLELKVMLKRFPDLLLRLDDGTILHIEFQAANHRKMPHRAGIYALMIAYKHDCRRIEQAVIYLGAAKMSMRDTLDTGGVQVRYRLISAGDLDADALLATGRPADAVLALLARNGVERLGEIVSRAKRLKGERRQRVLAQLAVISGLRGASEQLKMELKNMGLIDIEKNVILKEIRLQGRSSIVQDQLEQKFGRLPAWAKARLTRGTEAQTRNWARKVLTAETLEEVIGAR